MQTTRQQILTLLQHGDDVTVGQLAQKLDLAQASVRRHLDVLQRDNLISYRPEKQKTGRPEYIYFLTEAGHERLPKDYHRMLGWALQEIASLNKDDLKSSNGQELLGQIFAKMAHRLLDGYRKNLESSSLDQRLELLKKILEEQNFSPHIGQDNGGVVIKLLNCPFRSVALENAAICTFDSALISSVLGASALKERCIQDGDQCCMYLVQAKRQPISIPPSGTLRRS